MTAVRTSEELLNIIRHSEIAVYGTGFVAERFSQSLDKIDLGEKIAYYIETNPSRDVYRGKRIVSLENCRQNQEKKMICVAVHEANKDGIIKELEQAGIVDYIWIYPFVHELYFGRPIATNVKVPVSIILDKVNGDYRIPVRLLAIEEYYGRNDVGYSVYKKAQSLHCDEQTAERRLDKYIELIKSWEKNGYDADSRIKITDKNDVFDGVHRLALACYHGMDFIYCDVYEADKSRSFINDEVKITQELIKTVGLSDKEYQFLKNTISEKRIKK